MGFIIFAIPIVIIEEKSCLKEKINRIFFVMIGIVLVSVITYFNPVGGGNGMDLSNPNILTFVYVFVCGAIAICAMILPGISGSTLLLIFGSNQGYSAFQFSRTANRDRIWIGRGYRSDINYQDHQKSS